MKYALLLVLFIYPIHTLHAQEIRNTGQDPFIFFESITGIWEGAPGDSSFISVLEYQMGDQEDIIIVKNDLLTRMRTPLSHYEGTYYIEPTDARLEFKTMNKNETHSGYCKIAGDTLFHYATVRGPSQIRSYASAIVKEDSLTLAYYASYSSGETIPDLKFEQPLRYRRVK